MNVLVAAFATCGLCSDAFRVAAAEHELLVGEPVLLEMRRILETKLRLPEHARNEILRVLRRYTIVRAAKAPIELGIGDTADDWIVACALTVPADSFVTGDKALLELHRVQDMPIVSPREFWTQVRPASA